MSNIKAGFVVFVQMLLHTLVGLGLHHAFGVSVRDYFIMMILTKLTQMEVDAKREA